MRSVQHFRDSALRRAADARQNSLKYAIETFDVTLGKQILAKKPGDFQAFAVFGDFACRVGNARCPSSACSDARKDSAAKLPAWDGFAKQSALRKVDCIPLPPARRSRAPIQRKAWRWQKSRSSTDEPLVDDRRQRANDRSVRAEEQCPRSIPSFPARFAWCDWRPAFPRPDHRIRSIRRTQSGKRRKAH